MHTLKNHMMTTANTPQTKNMVPTQILLVDDHALVRYGVRSVLSFEAGFYFIGEAESGAQAVRQLGERYWDLVLLDVNLPDQSGFELLQHIRREWPKLPVLMYSMHTEEEYAKLAIRYGAVGYLSKQQPLSILLETINEIVANHH